MFNKATYSFLLPTKQGQTQRKAAKHIFLEPKHPYDACTSVPLKHLNSSKSFHHAKNMKVFICDSVLTSSGSKHKTNTKNNRQTSRKRLYTQSTCSSQAKTRLKSISLSYTATNRQPTINNTNNRALVELRSHQSHTYIYIYTLP